MGMECPVQRGCPFLRGSFRGSSYHTMTLLRPVVPFGIVEDN